MTITEILLKEIKSLSLTVDEYLILYSKYNKLNWTPIIRPSTGSYLKLEKMGYLTHTRLLTKKAIDIFQNEKETIQTDGTEKSIEEHFNEFWESYPRHDGILHFERSTREIRANKVESFRLYKLKLKDGVDPNDLLRGLNNELTSRITQSQKKGENLMKWMKGPVRWLKEDGYLNWLDYKVDTSSDNEYGKVVE